MSILDYFGDWPRKTATFKELSATYSNGVRTEVWTTVSTCSVWIYTKSSIQTSQNDKFVNKEVGEILYNPLEMVNAAGQTFNINKTIKAVIDGKDYHIEGKDNINRFDEVQSLIYQKDVI